MVKTPTGIYFEMVVEFFQKLVAGEGVTVERRAKIKDDDGKTIAEVDLLLSGLFGGVETKVAIECRDHKERPGTKWIWEIIGKRWDMEQERRGIGYWFAVSHSGFVERAPKVAARAGIGLLVAGDLEPQNARARAQHRVLKRDLRYLTPVPHPVRNVRVRDERRELARRVEDEIAARGLDAILPPDGRSPGMILNRELVPPGTGSAWTAAESELLSSATPVTQVDEVDVDLNGESVRVAGLEAEVDLRVEIVRSKFRMLTFANPDLQNVLGYAIGVNEYRHFGCTVYAMLGIKPGTGELIRAWRTEDGEEIPDLPVTITPAEAEAAGYRLSRG